MFKRFSLILFMFVLALSVVGPASAAGAGPNDATTPDDGGIGGVVPVIGQEKTSPSPFLSNLSYHGGPVMHTNKTYAIYWVPAGYAVSSLYRTHINQFFIDVAAASGLSSNVYHTDTQYYGPGAVHILYSSTFGGSYNDANPFPANGCSLYSTVIKCLSDAQIRAEIRRVIAVKGWVANATTMFFLFTPNRVGSCYSNTSCAFTSYCAYHGYTSNIIYANQPYTYSYPSACGVSKSPNRDFAADSTINVTSHEHNEAITDMHLNAWWDSSTGEENGDKCAWNFGSLAAGYNQTIHGHHYVLQQEWSNFSHACRLTGL